MNCPKCQKVMLDVRAEKSNPKAPDFQCPDASCLNDKGYRTGAWLPKGKAVARGVDAQGPIASPGAFQAPQNGPVALSPRDTFLIELYWDCFDRVLQGLKTRALTGGFNGEQIAACCATMFIARSKLLP